MILPGLIIINQVITNRRIRKESLLTLVNTKNKNLSLFLTGFTQKFGNEYFVLMKAQPMHVNV